LKWVVNQSMHLSGIRSNVLNMTFNLNTNYYNVKWLNDLINTFFDVKQPLLQFVCNSMIILSLID